MEWKLMKTLNSFELTKPTSSPSNEDTEGIFCVFLPLRVRVKSAKESKRVTPYRQKKSPRKSQEERLKGSVKKALEGLI